MNDNDIGVLYKYIDKLEEENKRLKKENKETIKFCLEINEGELYEVDTQVKKPLKEMEVYYLADDNKNPTPVFFIGYQLRQSCDNKFRIDCACINTITQQREIYFIKNLYKTKNKAIDAYLNKKWS